MDAYGACCLHTQYEQRLLHVRSWLGIHCGRVRCVLLISLHWGIVGGYGACMLMVGPLLTRCFAGAQRWQTVVAAHTQSAGRPACTCQSIPACPPLLFVCNPPLPTPALPTHYCRHCTVPRGQPRPLLHHHLPLPVCRHVWRHRARHPHAHVRAVAGELIVSIVRAAGRVNMLLFVLLFSLRLVRMHRAWHPHAHVRTMVGEQMLLNSCRWLPSKVGLVIWQGVPVQCFSSVQ